MIRIRLPDRPDPMVSVSSVNAIHERFTALISLQRCRSFSTDASWLVELDMVLGARGAIQDSLL
jgi:hypothetical protein